MGVDWLSCKSCGDTFPDCGCFVCCESCGTRWCSDGCAEEDGYIQDYCKKYDVCGNSECYEMKEMHKCEQKWCEDCEEFVPDSCKYCRGEDFDDSDLLKTALKLLGIDRKELVIKHKENL